MKNKMKFANYTDKATVISDMTGNAEVMEIKLRTGKKGTGKVLWTMTYWNNRTAESQAHDALYTFAKDNGLSISIKEYGEDTGDFLTPEWKRVSI